MNIVLDTSVFFPSVAGQGAAYLVYEKMIEVCDITVVETRLLKEYQRILIEKGFSSVPMLTRLTNLEGRGKLLDVTERIVSPMKQEVIKDPNDVMLLECAICSTASIITNDRKHLYDVRNQIKQQYDVDVLIPSDYLRLREK